MMEIIDLTNDAIEVLMEMSKQCQEQGDLEGATYYAQEALKLSHVIIPEYKSLQ